MRKKLESLELVCQSDWLASTPYFYHETTSVVSQNINDVIFSAPTFDFHPEGLYNFLECGFSVLGQTPIENVKFLSPSAKIWRCNNQKRIYIDESEDLLKDFIDYRLSEEDTIELIRSRVQQWEASLPPDQLIILPLSGGYDSRLLLWSLRDKTRVRAFTYGISKNQANSFETVKAREIAKKFRIEWQQIELGCFHQYIPEWYSEFGVSTHLHGMYHIEFYKKIRQKIIGNHALLSGIIGDSWAGSIPHLLLNESNWLKTLSYNHNLCADPKRLLLDSNTLLKNNFWRANQESLKDQRYQTITAMRLKIILLSYLIRLPKSLGFNAWSPFLEVDIAMAMLNLPTSRRLNRQWQIDFFQKEGLILEVSKMRSDKYNHLNRTAMKNVPLTPLNEDLLSLIVDPSYVHQINHSIVSTNFNRAKARLLAVPKLGGIMRLAGIKDLNLASYSAYLCLKSIEMLLSEVTLN